MTPATQERLRACSNGHPKEPGAKRCRACKNQQQAEYRRRNPKPLSTVSAEPLAILIYRQLELELYPDGLRGLAIHMAANLGKHEEREWQVIESDLYRVTRPGSKILWTTADRLAAGLGKHITEIYDAFDWTEGWAA